jgi:hypothetical protein
MNAKDRAIVTRWRGLLAIRSTLLRAARKRHEWNPTPASRALIDKRKAQVAYAERVIARRVPLTTMRQRAYAYAASLVGVMEQGGNNRGAKVTEIIRANGGTGPEPWCGDFVAYCYRKAGSKVVDRRWAYVPYLSLITGVRRTTSPKKGDLVRFEFNGDNTPDHIGLFVEDIGDGTIVAIEGNTGATGAVSDSTTGGDGVYRKVRSKRLVKDYLEVTR